MKREWQNPYGLEPRPSHRATEEEQEAFHELLETVGLVVAHLGGTLEFHVSFRLPRKRKPKPAGGTT